MSTKTIQFIHSFQPLIFTIFSTLVPPQLVCVSDSDGATPTPLGYRDRDTDTEATEIIPVVFAVSPTIIISKIEKWCRV